MERSPPGFVDTLPAYCGWKLTRSYRGKADGPTDPLSHRLPKPFVAVVIGAGKGIGAAIARSYAQAGATGIILSSRTSKDLEAVALDINKLNPNVRVEHHVADVVSPADMANLASVTGATFHRVDAVVVNAGVVPKFLRDSTSDSVRFPRGILEDTTEDFLRVFNTNFVGTYLAAKAFLPLLLATPDGAQALICTSSASSQFPDSQFSPVSYNVSKLATNRLVEYVHEAYRDKGIVAYAFHPGGIQTPMTLDYPGDWLEALQDDISLPGGFCVWLTSEKRSWLSGRYLSANWDVTELLAKKDEITAKDMLKSRLTV